MEISTDPVVVTRVLDVAVEMLAAVKNSVVPVGALDAIHSDPALKYMTFTALCSWVMREHVLAHNQTGSWVRPTFVDQDGRPDEPGTGTVEERAWLLAVRLSVAVANNDKDTFDALYTVLEDDRNLTTGTLVFLVYRLGQQLGERKV